MCARRHCQPLKSSTCVPPGAVAEPRFGADTMAASFRSIVGCIDHATGRFCEARRCPFWPGNRRGAGSLIPSFAFRFGRRIASRRPRQRDRGFTQAPSAVTYKMGIHGNGRGGHRYRRGLMRVSTIHGMIDAAISNATAAAAAASVTGCAESGSRRCEAKSSDRMRWM